MTSPEAEHENTHGVAVTQNEPRVERWAIPERGGVVKIGPLLFEDPDLQAPVLLDGHRNRVPADHALDVIVRVLRVP